MTAAAPIDVDSDSWLPWAIRSLWFCGVVYLLLGLVLPFAMLAPLLLESGRPGGMSGVVASVVVVLILGLSVACAAANVLLAQGLKRRASWAWVGAIVAGGIYAPSGCMPVGALLLYTVLRPGFRDGYLAAANR